MDSFIDKSPFPETPPQPDQGSTSALDSLVIPSTETLPSPQNKPITSPDNSLIVVENKRISPESSDNNPEIILLTLHGANADSNHPMHEWVSKVAQSDMAPGYNLRHLTIEYDSLNDPQQSGEALAKSLPTFKPGSKVIIVGHSQGAYVGHFAAKELQQHYPVTVAMLDRPLLSDFQQQMVSLGDITTGIVPSFRKSAHIDQGAGISRGQDELSAQTPPYALQEIHLEHHDPWHEKDSDPEAMQRDFKALTDTIKTAIRVAAESE